MKKTLLAALCFLSYSQSPLHATDRVGVAPSSSVRDLAVEKSAVLSQFVENLVLPQYRALQSSSETLAAEISIYVQQRNQASLDRARAAWRASRTPWEQSEAFLFGPVDSLGYDPALDSWPLDLGAFASALPEFAAQEQLDMFEVDPALKGFHAMEYLLFGLNNDKELESFTESEYRYLQSLATHQVEIAALLLSSWTEGSEGSPAFAETFKTAGAPENEAYPSQTAAFQELLEGMAGIADELALTKLGEPLESRDPNLVESRFSHNSLADFLSNLQGIRMVYMGGTGPEPEAASIAALVTADDSALHQKILAALNQTQVDLEKIPQPFVAAIGYDEGRNLVAMAKQSASTLFASLDQDLRAYLAR